MNENNKLSIMIKFLPFVFALHNIEEAWHISCFGQTIQSPFLVNSVQFIIAVSLFTVLGFVLVFVKRIYPTDRSSRYAVTGFSGMLFLNSFIPHIFSAIFFRSYTSGLVTASFLVLPLTASILWQTYKSQIFSNKQLIAAILLGGILGLILVFVFLGVGFLLTN